MRYAFASLAAALLTMGILGTDVNAQVVYSRGSQDADVQLVDSWYRHYLGWPVDQVGLQSWLPELANGHPEAGILGSLEYFNRHGGTPQGFVTGLYVEVLGRQPDADEVQGWLFRLQQMGGDRISLADEFLRSAATELSLRGLPQSAPGYQPVVPQIVEPTPAIVPSPEPGYVYGSVWYGSGYRPYWGSRGYWRGTRFWVGTGPYRGGFFGGGQHFRSWHGHR